MHFLKFNDLFHEFKILSKVTIEQINYLKRKFVKFKMNKSNL